MSKETRPEWHGHCKAIANIIGCSTTTVSKILNGRSEEVTNNQELIHNVKHLAADFLLKDKLLLLRQAEKKQEVADALTGANTGVATAAA